MRTSARTTAAHSGALCVRLTACRLFFVALLLVAFAALPVSAQTLVNPTTNTVLFSGQDAASLNTGPLGGIILPGTAISVFTGQPVRHLWVADTFASLCRMDPEIDAPGPWDINILTCQYSVFRGGGAIPLGGQLAYDPTHNFLYFVDNNTASQGVIRIGYNPAGDNGHGAYDLTHAFTLGGGAFARIGPFAGGTGCPYPGPAARRAKPSGAALSPLGDLWVGFADGGDIIRFNSPATATETGFGSCDQFVQAVATTPDGALSNGLAFLGHNLFAGDGTSPFVIPNADTTCLVPPSPACSTANGTVIPILPAVGATGSLSGDQVYPAVNGNNLYYGVGSQIAWVGNVAQGLANSTLTVTYMNEAGINPPPNPAIAAITASPVDTTDPANQVVYAAEDPVILINPLAFGNARWWQTTQTSAGPAAPGTPQNVVAVAQNAQISLSWSPAQAAQPVTSYTVRNSFISSGAPLADIVVNPPAGGIYPPTSIVIPAVNGVSYAFEVSASNANGTSPFSAQSNIVTPPGIGVPAPPTGTTAIAGDTQAIVTWTVSAFNGGSPITGYAVNVLDNGLPTPIFVIVPPPSFTSNTQSALVGGLTNGDSYTFTVQAINIAGFSAPSNVSNAVIPSSANVPAISITQAGPTSESIVPAMLTDTITVTNSTLFPMTNVNVTDTLNTVPANISLITRDANGLVTVSTTTNTLIIFNAIVTVAGVNDPSFNGTFTVTNTPTTSTFTYSQANLGLPVASSTGGTVTIQPTANIVSVQTGQGTCTSGGPGVFTFSCNIGFLDVGQLVRIPVIIQMQKQTIINSAVVSGTDFAGTPLVNKTASVTTSVPVVAGGNSTTTDLQVSGSAVNGGPTVTGTLPTGAPDTYNWQIRNATSVPANNVVFTQTMPASLVFQSLTTDLPADLGVCTGPAPGTPGGTVTCASANLGGSRKNGAKPVQQFKLTVNVNVVQVGTISTTGTVSFAGIDTNPKNDSVTVNINAK